MGKVQLVFAVAVGTALCLMADRLVLRAAAQDAPVFATESSLVVLHVTVKDKQGRYVGGLSRMHSTSSRTAGRRPCRSLQSKTHP